MTAPVGLAERGREAWALLTTDRTLSPAAAILAGEACRIIDRLDRLDLLLTEDVKTWARLVHRTQTEDYELIVDEALAEARQQAATLRQLLTTVEAMTAKEPGDRSGALEAFLAGMSAPLRHEA